MGEQSLTYFAYVCFMPRNDGVFLPYCCAYHELCVRTVSRSVSTRGPITILLERPEGTPGCLATGVQLQAAKNRREELASVYKVLYPHLLVYAIIGAETR
jgi:hypothetical protein